MSQMTMFPGMVPEGDPPLRAPEIPTYLAKTTAWKLVRRGRRTDAPAWHKITAPSSEGGVITKCKLVGSLVFTEVPNGATIRACTDCLGPTGV